MKAMTKKDIALTMHASGRSVEEIAHSLKCSPSYVANVLVGAGKKTDYTDLYTNSTAQNEYARMFQGVLRFKNVEAATQAVERIDELFHQFARDRDRRGQHQAQLMALIGKNRAEGIGKNAEAKVFAEWLRTHLDIAEAAVCDVQPPLDFDTEPSDYSQISPYEGVMAFA